MLGAFKTKDAHILDTLDEVREVSDEWIHDYSHHRPHDVFNNLPSKECTQQHLSGGTPGKVLQTEPETLI